MWGWFKKRAKPLQPEASWSVIVGENDISVSDHEGRTRAIAKCDLCGVAIETNDTGPWGADVWWLLFGADERLVCAFPQGASGDQAAVDYLTRLAGFDHDEMIKAMASMQNAVFPVWRTPGLPDRN